jgi:hypothetical protein
MRLLLATVSIRAGGALTAATYWGFLNTPESTVPALLLSAVLALLALLLLSMTINAAIAAWSAGWSLPGLRRTLPHVTSIVPAMLVVLLLWWIAGRIDTWVALRTGGINAWFIARFGWDDVSWLFAAVRYFTTWLRWVLGGLLAVSLMAGIAATGWRALAVPAWLLRALRPRTLAVATAWFAILIVLPWVYLVPWRPEWIPPTGAELTFIVSKLSVSAVLIATGVALMIHEAVRMPVAPTDPQSQQIAA